jgi:F-box/leucine-rich repeat protein 2/20
MSDLTIEDIENQDFVEESFTVIDLPDEVILHIFSYLSTYEICHLIAPVCRHFHRLSYDPCLIRSISLKPTIDQSDVEFVVAAISRSRCLSSLVIKSRQDAEFLASTAAKNCPRLEKLEIIYCNKLSDDCLASIVDSEVGQSLKSLNLECTPLSTHWGTSQVTKLANLTSLNLFNCRFFDSFHLAAIAYNCEKLEKLNLEEVTHLSEESVITLINERRNTLTCLYLDGESLSDTTFKHLFECSKLEELGISFAEDIGESGITAISQLGQLRILKLKRAKKVAADDFITLFANKKLGNVIHLDLSECVQLDDECVITIALACPKLERLVLNWCWEIQDKGLEFMVQYCNAIIKLHLVGVVLLTDAFLEDICDHLPKLAFLDLQQCPNITDSNLEYIVKLCSHDLEIVNYYGEVIQKYCSGSAAEKTDHEDRSDKESSTTEEALNTDDISDDLSGAF